MALQLPLIDSDPTNRSTRRRRRNGTGVLAVVPDHLDVLVEVAGPDWRIDDETKEVGLAGVAAARDALAAAVGRAAAGRSAA